MSCNSCLDDGEALSFNHEKNNSVPRYTSTAPWAVPPGPSMENKGEEGMDSCRLRTCAPLVVVAGILASTPIFAQDVDRTGFDFGVPLPKPFVCENDAHGVELMPITGEP